MAMELDKLSDGARRWLQFFQMRTRAEVAMALSAGFIAPGKRPGLTESVCIEIEKWATEEIQESPHTSKVVSLTNRAY